MTTPPADHAPDDAPQPATVASLTRLDLARDFPALDGRELRLQLTTYAPGAIGTPHSHDGRVEVVFVMSGAIIEHHGDGRRVEYMTGDAFAANCDTMHHLENAGSEPACLVVAMIADADR